MKYILFTLPAIVLIGFGCTAEPVVEDRDLEVQIEEIDSTAVEIETQDSDSVPIDIDVDVDVDVDVDAVDTQAEADDLALRLLSIDEWRRVDQWLQLDNGNVWLLTWPIVTKGDPLETNPCAVENICLVESWIVNPTEGTAYLSSTQNSYYSGIFVTPKPLEDGYLQLDWDISIGNVSRSDHDRTEYISQIDGSMRP